MSRGACASRAPSGCRASDYWLCCRASTGSRPTALAAAIRQAAPSSSEVPLFRLRFAVLAALALVPVLAPSAASAAAEVHRFSVALSATPTSINAGDVNDAIDFYNRTVVTPPPRGYDPLDKIGFSWLFNSELRYFLTRNLAVDAGVRSEERRVGKECRR